MTDSTSSSAALEGFVTLAQQPSTTGVACKMLIEQVLKHPQIYVFGELLTEPNVLDLDNRAEFKPHLDLLRIFAYGTWSDYKVKAEVLNIKLTPVMITKLKQLTVVTFASKHKTLPYGLLLKELELSNIRELEDMIIECVYQGLVSGRLDQKKAAFEVSSSIGRDIGPNDVNFMINVLQKWLSSSRGVQAQLEGKIREANEEQERAARDKQQHQAEHRNLVAALKAQQDQKASQSNDMASGLLGSMAGAFGLESFRKPKPAPRHHR